MNYLIQNTNRDENPMNIKEVVLDDLRRHGIFVHLRDEGNIGYDMDKWLPSSGAFGIQAKENEIASYKKILDARKKELEDLETNSTQLYDIYVKKAMDNFLAMKKEVEETGGESRYRANISDIERRIEALQSFLDTFELDDAGIKDFIKGDVSDMIEALREDLEEYSSQAESEEDSARRLLDIDSPKVKTFEEWFVHEKQSLEGSINFYEEQIEDLQKAIKRLKVRDAQIRKLFKALEPFDKEIK